MKGGITSGVVYPGAIFAIAEKYRLRDIGGSSAGAIAATFAAAAEYRRQTNGGADMAGFIELDAAGKSLGDGLKALFQPTPALKPLFRLLEAAIATPHPRFGKWPAILRAVGLAFWPVWVAAVVAIIAVASYGLTHGFFWVIVIEKLFVILVALGVVTGYLAYLVFWELPKNDFGLCAGLNVKGGNGQGFCEWIADRIDTIAGKGSPATGFCDPLTIGDLGKFGDCESIPVAADPCKGIRVAAMTTDLSSGRPYQLPLKDAIHWFSRGEFELLFPQRVVNYLCRKGERRTPRPDDPPDLPRDLYPLPVGDDFPVLLVARLSLSFPILIRAVPLWREDDSVTRAPARPIRRCLFSDGGISSNFPIHFFDALLPSRPTFGIALDAFDCKRHTTVVYGPGNPEALKICNEDHLAAERVHLPDQPSPGGPTTSMTGLPVRDIGRIVDFFYRIVNVAKDWQDTLQSRLPGYAERIVTVRLVDGVEGGMKLDMEKPTVLRLVALGKEAGTLLATTFDMTQHRWNRALTNFSAIEPALSGLAQAYQTPYPDGGGNSRSYDWVLTQYALGGTAPAAPWRSDVLAPFARDLANFGVAARLRYDTHGSIYQTSTQEFDGSLRLVASPDRVPTQSRGWAPWCAPDAPTVVR
nr:patatin-like phospholipase family protein [Jiella sonneratiae]